MKRKILVIGLDGATWDILHPLMENGDLPRFRKWAAGGCSGVLKSTVPALTPPGWTSAFTGVNPGKHNVYDFFSLDKVTMKQRLATSRDRRYPAFWETASREGARVGLFNVPCAYPADKVEGFMVTGMATPEGSRDFGYPGEAALLIKEKFPGYRFGARASLLESGRKSDFLKDIYRVTDTQEKAALELLKSNDVDLFLFVYDETDRVMHFFWHDFDPSHPAHEKGGEFRNAVRDYYRRVEEGVERFISAMGGDVDLVVFSDHGFGPLETDIHVNRLLYEWGFLAVKPVAEEMIKKPLWKRALKRIVPPGARKVFREKVRPSPLADPLGYIDFEKSRAFYASVSGRSIYVPDKDDRERTISELVSRLEGFVDGRSGRNPFAKVFRKEEIYTGPFLENAPDLVIQEDGRFAFKVEWSGSVSSEATQHGCLKSGSHRPEGMFFLSGPSFRENRKMESAGVCDMAPTLLAMMGLPVGAEMDGRPLSWAFKEYRDTGSREYSGLRIDVEEGPLGDDAQVREKLKSLGYM